MRLLVTRPEPEAERTAALLRSLGHEVLVMPMLRIEVIADVDLGRGPWAALIITSANAVRAVAAHARVRELRSLPVFVVGGRTGEAAHAAGFEDVISADGDAAALAQLIVGRVASADAPLLYLAGEDHAGEIAGFLSSHGFDVQTVVVYRAVAEGALSGDVQAALGAGKVDGVLHFSRRSAEAVLGAADAAGMRDKVLRIQHYCLSGQVAAAFEGMAAKHVHVAAKPHEQALIGLIVDEGR